MKAPLVVQGSSIITLGEKRQNVLALDLDGEELWRSDRLEEYSYWSLFVQDLVWAPIYSNKEKRHCLLAFETRTGRLRHRFEDAPPAQTFLEDRAFLGKRYRPEGKDIETFGLYRVGKSVETVWEVEVSSVVGRGLGWRCASEGGRVFIEHGSDVVALDAKEGRELWRTELGQFGKPWGPNSHQLSVAAGVVVQGVMGSLHGLSAATGKILWTFQGKEAGLNRAVYNGFVTGLSSGYFGDRNECSRFARIALNTGEVVAASSTSGDVAWAAAPQPSPLFSSVPRPADNAVLAGDRDGRLWALSPSTGSPLWCQGLPGTSGWLDDIIVASGRVFVRDASGRRYCLR